MRCALWLIVICGFVSSPMGVSPAHAATVESYLISGDLPGGERALEELLKAKPADDQARFGLAAVQFFRSYERLGTSLYRHGMRATRPLQRQNPELAKLLPENPNPDPLTYPLARKIVQTFVDDMNRAEATLAQIKDPAVKLPLRVGLIRLDLFGLGQPVSPGVIFGRLEAPIPQAQLESFVIGFDRGDVCWLRGYCHFFAGLGEILLALDGQELFDCSAHVFFAKVVTPHTFLLEYDPDPDNLMRFERPLLSDVIAFIHLMLRHPLKEPARMTVALRHFESTLAMSKEMWQHYLKETDDEHEWIPNPKQQGVMQVAVSQEVIDTWLSMVNEAELVLQGKRLLPFWRGKPDGRGLNLRKVFTEPRTLDIILWIQGTAATPYLERGEMTKFTDGAMLGRINQNFQGPRVWGWIFWFN